jgi:hypothetical protein
MSKIHTNIPEFCRSVGGRPAIQNRATPSTATAPPNQWCTEDCGLSSKEASVESRRTSDL